MIKRLSAPGYELEVHAPGKAVAKVSVRSNPDMVVYASGRVFEEHFGFPHPSEPGSKTMDDGSGYKEVDLHTGLLRPVSGDVRTTAQFPGFEELQKLKMDEHWIFMPHPARDRGGFETSDLVATRGKEEHVIERGIADGFGLDAFGFAFFAKGDALFVRQVIPVDSAWIDGQQIGREKEASVARMERIAQVLLQYGQKHGEQLPPALGWEAALTPYLERPDQLQGFTLFAPGLFYNKQKSSNSVVVGSLKSRLGRAVLYADFHVEWKPGA